MMIPSLIQTRKTQATMAKRPKKHRNEKNKYFQYVHDCVVPETHMYATISEETSVYMGFFRIKHVCMLLYTTKRAFKWKNMQKIKYKPYLRDHTD